LIASGFTAVIITTIGARKTKTPNTRKLVVSVVLWCVNPARIGLSAGTTRGGRGDLPFRVNAMEAVNAATLPHQHKK